MVENVTQIKIGTMINVDVSTKNMIMINVDVSVKNIIYVKKLCSCENGKYLTNIMEDSGITCDEIIESYDEETKTIPTNFNEKKATCETQNFYILLDFLLITIPLLISVSIN